MPCCEVKITVKDEETKLTRSFLVYEIFTTSPDDPILNTMIQAVKKDFKGNPSDIDVKIKIEVV